MRRTPFSRQVDEFIERCCRHARADAEEGEEGARGTRVDHRANANAAAGDPRRWVSVLGGRMAIDEAMLERLDARAELVAFCEVLCARSQSDHPLAAHSRSSQTESLSASPSARPRRGVRATAISPLGEVC